MKNGARTKSGVGALVIGLTSVSVAACATTVVVPMTDESGPADITVTASDTTCQVSTTQVPAGRSTFVITNNGTKATEFYILGVGGRVMGAVENISPGLQRKLVVKLAQPGTYQTSCRPGLIGDGMRGSFSVTGDEVPMTADAKFEDAAESYKRYLTVQADALVTATAAFVGAIKKGDIVGAEAIYPVARTYYQRTRPAAASFPDDLIARIGLRENDLEPGEQWSGFHRLEKDLWTSGLQPDTDAMADQLLADVKQLDADIKAPTWKVDSTRIAAGAQALIESVAAYMVSGNDEKFSHTDLRSFQASIDGAQAAVASIRPVLDGLSADLGSQVDAQFAAVDELLSKHRDGDGFVFYDKVTAPDRQELVQSVQALAAVVGRVQAAISA